MFVRLLELPDDVRHAFDISTLRVAINPPAACPIDIKQAMIDWWGPILFEYHVLSRRPRATAAS